MIIMFLVGFVYFAKQMFETHKPNIREPAPENRKRATNPKYALMKGNRVKNSLVCPGEP